MSLGGIDNLRGITTTPDAKLSYRRTRLPSADSGVAVGQQRAPALAELVARIGSTPRANLGTIGGNVCHNEMGAICPAHLPALNAVVECGSARGKRSLPLSGFRTGDFETFLAPGLEKPPPLSCRDSRSDSRWTYLEHTRSSRRSCHRRSRGLLTVTKWYLPGRAHRVRRCRTCRFPARRKPEVDRRSSPDSGLLLSRGYRFSHGGSSQRCARLDGLSQKTVGVLSHEQFNEALPARLGESHEADSTTVDLNGDKSK